MRIAIATMKGGLEDDVSQVMGRCASFTIVEVEEEEIKDTKVVKNEFANAGGGAGIQAAQLVADQGVDALIAGNFGPNAFDILEQAGIKLVQAQGNVKEAVLKYAKGELKPLDSSTSPKFGGLVGQPGTGRGMGRGMGRGRGRGFGKGNRV